MFCEVLQVILMCSQIWGPPSEASDTGDFAEKSQMVKTERHCEGHWGLAPVVSARSSPRLGSRAGLSLAWLFLVPRHGSPALSHSRGSLLLLLAERPSPLLQPRLPLRAGLPCIWMRDIRSRMGPSAQRLRHGCI